MAINPTREELAIERVQQDLRPFADPGTKIRWTARERSVDAEWASRGRKLEATFLLRTRGGVAVKFEGKTLSYSQFLSHPLVADILGLARMINQASEPQLYVPTRASDPRGTAGPALDVINGLLGEDGIPAQISVVFITGDAGAGKTSVLTELVRTQATRYLRGETAVLYFYVNAQGRALARLDEALAVALQDLRAQLTYDALPTLVRNGLVVPVVDGFDELLGVTGYDDAFASLRRFIDELRVGGKIVAAARSTYYEQEFLERAKAVPQAWELLPVRVLEWGDSEFRDYVDAKFAAAPRGRVLKKDFASQVRAFFEDPSTRGFRGKPFFVAKAAELVLHGDPHKAGSSLIDQLVSEYIERDRTEKIVDVGGAPILTREQIEGLFVLVAEEMWVQETRELDLASMAEVTQLFLDETKLSASSRERVVQRSAKSAFLKVGRTTNRVEFEHEALLSYFLARALAEVLSKSVEATRAFLVRGILPPYCGQFAASLAKGKGSTAEALIATANAAGDTSLSRAHRVKENAGTLVASVFRIWSGKIGPADRRQVLVKGCVFAGESFTDISISDCQFEGVEFRRVDFTGARVERSKAIECFLFDITVDLASTHLDIEGVDPAMSVSGLHVRDKDGTRTVYIIKDVVQVLAQVGMPLRVEAAAPTRKIKAVVLELVQNVMEAFQRANVIWPADDRHAKIANDPNWDGVRSLLLKSGIIVSEPRDHKGTWRESLRRKFAPAEVLAGVNLSGDVPMEIRDFWTALEQEYGQKGKPAH